MKNFTLQEFTCKCGRCSIPAEAKNKLMALVDQVLDPARKKLGRPIHVNSGYRCEAHNSKVGGATNSQHMRGEAADLTCDDNLELARIIVANGNFDQLILYPKPWSQSPKFIHVSFKTTAPNRHQILKKVEGHPNYTPLSIIA